MLLGEQAAAVIMLCTVIVSPQVYKDDQVCHAQTSKHNNASKKDIN